MPIKRICEICKSKFWIKQYRRTTAKFCSSKCYGISIRGKRNSSKTEFKKGQHSSPATEFKKRHKSTHGFKKGHKPWNTNKKYPQFSGKNHWHWKGGEIISTQGYILIHQPSHPRANKIGYIRRSRLVMEKHLGRYLTPKECIHHINHIKDDDRIENLMLFPNLSIHTRLHRLKII